MTCFEWVGSRNSRGYGTLSRGKRRGLMAHRVSYEMVHGEIPAGSVVMHSCNNKACVNPDHLKLGSYRENFLDAMTDGLVLRKLTPEDARAIRADKRLLKLVADEYGISISMASRIRRGLSWGHV